LHKETMQTESQIVKPCVHPWKEYMKKSLIPMLLALSLITSARANTALSVGEVTIIIPGGPCWDDSLITPAPVSASNTFTLTEVSGVGTVTSVASYKADNVHGGQHVLYVYSLDLSGMTPAPNHCITLLVHFGPPLGCDYDVLLLTNGTSSINVSSAELAAYGDITFQFDGGCLLPSQTATTFAMVSDTGPKGGSVTVIDTYTDPASGQTNVNRVNVGAIVPSIPPDWAYAFPPLPYWFPSLQGSLVTNYYQPPTNGFYHFVFQLMDGSNGLPVSTMVTQTVQVVNGLFTAPLPFDPTVFIGNPVWLNTSILGSNGPVPLNPPLQVTPTPQALYAYSAGVVAGLSPGQAVTSLNGITDGVTLEAGAGIILETNGNTLTVSTQPGTLSDRNMKTGFKGVEPADILERLAALPIESWRYTNETAGIRHIGPMAQDFKAVFGLGNSDKLIEFVDEQGVALSAVQGLNQKVESENSELRAENAELKRRLDALEKIVLDKK
jgi:hypothetical protein